MLGWKVVGGKPEYPAVFISDGASTLTLWRVENPAGFVDFNRRSNVGHHLALRVPNREALDALHTRIAAWPGVVLEFAPQLSGTGPKVHLMFRVPGGNRIEVAWDPRK